MLEGITWGHFAVVMGSALILYFIVLVATGQLKLKNIGGNNGNNTQPSKKIWRVEEGAIAASGEGPQLPEVSFEQGENHRVDGELEKQFSALETLATELQDICAMAGPDITKEALTAQLRQQIAAYPTLNTAAFKGAITNIIVKAAEVDCQIPFTTAEADALWQ